MPLQIETQPFQFNNTVTGLSSAVFNSVSATALSGAFYGDGSKLTGISTYNGSDVKALTGNWQSTFNTVSALSGNWNTAYNISTGYRSVSSTFITLSSNATPFINNVCLVSSNNSISGTCAFISYNSYGSPGQYGTPPNVFCNNLIGGGSNNIILACAASSGGYDNGNCTTYNIAGCTISCLNSILNGTNNTIQNNCMVYNGSDQPYRYSGTNCIINNFIGTGNNNKITSCNSTILNGVSGFISNNSSFIGNGSCNSILAYCGAYDSSQTYSYNFIGNGCCNRTCNNYSSVLNGRNNTSSGAYSTILNGSYNDDRGLANVTILGTGISANNSNTVFANNMCVTGRYYGDGGSLANIPPIIYICADRGYGFKYDGCNTITSYSYPGYSNIERTCSAILNGRRNCISTGSAEYQIKSSATIASGLCNSIIGLNANNCTHSHYSTTAEHSLIAGGCCNNILATGCGYYYYIGSCQPCGWCGAISNTSFSTIINGTCNNIVDGCLVTNCNTSSTYSTIINGAKNTISKNSSFSLVNGCCNIACGNYNTILNGYKNSLSGTNNFILGSNISVSANNYTFVNNISSQDAGFIGGTTTLNSRVNVGGIISSNYSGAVDSTVVLSGGNTKGGAGYNDFLRVYNPTGANNLWFRTNSTGGLELLNSDYSKNIYSINQQGNINIYGNNSATSTSNDGVSGTIRFNNNNSQIYDDGNMHIHSRGSGQTMWVNTNGGQLSIGNQIPVVGGSVMNGITIGSSTTVKAYVSIYGSKTYSIGAYGFTAAGGTGTGGGTTGNFSLYTDSRIQAEEFDATSDECLKDVISTVPLVSAINFIKSVDGILYTWKPDTTKEENDKGIKAGFSAQRVHKAGFDHMLGAIPNDNLSEEVDSDGWVHPDKMQLTMGYNQAIPYHHEVIKNLLNRIEELEATVAELKK